MLQPDTYLVIAWIPPAPGARLDSEEPFVFPAPGEDSGMEEMKLRVKKMEMMNPG